LKTIFFLKKKLIGPKGLLVENSGEESEDIPGIPGIIKFGSFRTS